MGVNLSWTAQQAGRLDYGGREKAVAESGREMQTFAVDSVREQRAVPVTRAAGIRHGIVEAGNGRGVVSIFGSARAERMVYRSRREANLYPADARRVLPEDPCSMGCGQAREVIKAQTGITGASWSPDGAGAILKLRALVVNDDQGDQMTCYKRRYLEGVHLTRYDPASIPDLSLTA